MLRGWSLRRAPGRSGAVGPHRASRGQNTVEYLLMLAVIVGVALVLGKMFKGQIGGLFSSIMASIQSAAGQLSSNQGSN